MKGSWVALALTLGSALPAAAAQDIDLAPHRAEYALEQARASEGGRIVAVEGRLSYAISETCDTWRVEHMLELGFQGNSGEIAETRSETTAVESKDGLSYDFTIRNLVGGEVAEEYSGRGELVGPGGEGRVVLENGEPETAALPAGTMFPVAHTIASLRAAQAGERLFWALTYDGSERTDVHGVNVVIGNREEGAGDHPLLRGPRWHFSVAYFERDAGGQGEQEPVFEFAGPLYANGVTGDMMLDYGDFVLRGRLVALEALDRPEC